ncbi:putative modin protein [Phaeoacremonium minimum UCRPA7]|uniref:Putative modin protein n=1 Tax=Phaeoacremonium minimum (strain UCR-PA7) TaxID=1286976 RepID=R8BCZ0_PHAM7|nr:putative modin protein [Phaeoacremonium minimum UCRPA7]EON97168.1 putative modin protein [Phaeoacremonium minimum UCRPA7]
MGRWSLSKRRKFRFDELRFEVQFEAPVIFVCPPSNSRGPVANKPIWYIDGTEQSLKLTRIELDSQDAGKAKQLTAGQRQRQEKDSIHTADNDRATWVTMLTELQRMEDDSRVWQNEQYKRKPEHPQVEFRNHTLAVAVQSKPRSWDTMPSNVKKPYATTTMCHMIEMAAILGLHWKEFDRSRDKYRAEGNGCVLTGTHVSDLGIMFTFQIAGKRKFTDNRLIPVDEAKELCFGYVPTIFRSSSDPRRLDPFEEPKDIEVMQFSSRAEIAETVTLLGCNKNTSNYFLNDGKKHSHLFPIAFEIIGMLGKSLHIKNSCFRMLPNPTIYHWDKKFFSLRKLLHEFRKNVGNSDLTLPTDRVAAIEVLAERVEDSCKVAGGHEYPLALTDALHDSIDKCDEFLRGDSRSTVLLVIRHHLQEVLAMLNEEKVADADGDGSDDDVEPPKFEDLNAASPEERQKKFMEIYFVLVLDRVKTKVQRATLRKSRTTAGTDYSNATLYVPYSGTLRPETPISGSVTPSPSPSPEPLGRDEKVDVNGTPNPDASIIRSTLLRKHDSGFMEGRASDIWCTLQFRMLCWLLLHDFHKRDVQNVNKSELLGSRLPVYIA